MSNVRVPAPPHPPGPVARIYADLARLWRCRISVMTWSTGHSGKWLSCAEANYTVDCYWLRSQGDNRFWCKPYLMTKCLSWYGHRLSFRIPLSILRWLRQNADPCCNVKTWMSVGNREWRLKLRLRQCQWLLYSVTRILNRITLQR